MHIAMIIDEQRLAHEQAMLNRLAVGLMGEGVQVTRIVPEGAADEVTAQHEKRIAIAKRIEAPMWVLPWMRRARVSRLDALLEKHQPDLLFAIGELAWRLGLDLAGALDKPLLLEVWSMEQVRHISRLDQLPQVAGYIAPCAGIAQALRLHVDSALVSLAPMGVAIPPEPRSVRAESDQAPTLAILGGCRDMTGYRTLLGALARIAAELPALQIFLELRGASEHDIWKLAKRLNLMSNVSPITHADHYRELLTSCDLLLMPEQLGELRSLMLEAMALAVPVVASSDPALEMLVTGQTALLIAEQSVDGWVQAIRTLLKRPEEARRLGLAARAAVAAAHRSSDQVLRSLDTFEKVISGGALAFRKSG